MRDIWVKNYLLLVVLIPGCDSCGDNVIMSRISELTQETSASQTGRGRGATRDVGVLDSPLLALDKNLDKTFRL